MKRIGIITQYHNSTNYGGMLQAYALTKFLNSQGFNAEQICYAHPANPDQTKHNKFKIKNILSNIIYKFLFSFIKKSIALRKEKFENFANNIPHSKKAYTDNSLAECNEIYDIFIAGSDQIWNPLYYTPAYFLNFAQKHKRCISYAASISGGELTLPQKERFEQDLKKFYAISIREDETNKLQPITNVPVKWVLDPTLLLSKENWDEIASKRLIKDKYVFCYFLGHDNHQKKIAKHFAKKHHLKLVTIPHLSGTYNLGDLNFGDKKMTYSSPEDFISLIKYTDYVFTDSFHCTVFSNIYKKTHFVFHRFGRATMSSRIYSLCSLFNTTKFFLNTPEKATVSYVESVIGQSASDIRSEQKFKLKKQESEQFLISSLKE